MDDLIRDFVDETMETLDLVEADVLRVDSEIGEALHARVFRLLHTIKGTSGFLGLPKLEALAHAGEDQLIGGGSTGPVPVIKVLDDVRSMLGHLAVHGTELNDPVAQPPSLHAAAIDAKAPTALVSAERIEQLLADVSELAMARTQLVSAARRAEAITLRDPIDRISHVVDLIEGRVAQATMQRIDAAWRQAPRVARDIAKDLGKDIRVEMSGGSTEIDRGAFATVRESIVHLVRNAAGHGIETISERQTLGKPSQGVITLAAWQDADAIIFTVADDGRGLPIDGSRTKARPAVTMLSGRGVGLAAVREAIEGIGGTFAVRSSPGIGVTFEMRVPLVAAVVPCLLLAVAGRMFALSQVAVLEIVRPPFGRSGAQNGVAQVHSRFGHVPIIDLGQHLAMTQRQNPDGLLVLCEDRGRRFGLRVDKILESAPVSIKPIAGPASEISVYAGAALDPAGDIALVLNPGFFAKHFGVASTPAERPEAQPVRADIPVLEFSAGDRQRRFIPLDQLNGVVMAGSSDVLSLRRMAQVTRVKPAYPGLDVSMYRQPMLLVRRNEGTIGIAVEAIGDVQKVALPKIGPADEHGYVSFELPSGEVALVLSVESFFAEHASARGDLPLVLVLESDPFCREFLVDVVRALGYAASSIDPEAPSQLPPRLAAILADLDSDGAITVLTGARVTAPVIGVTSRLDASAAERARKVGIIDIAGKFDRPSLRHVLRGKIIGQDAA